MLTDTMGEKTEKTKTFNMRLSPEEWARFEGLAARFGLPVASTLRLLVRKEETALACSEERWELVRNEAERLTIMAEIPGLALRLDDATRTVILDDGTTVRAFIGGQGMHSALTDWPTSKLKENNQKLDQAFRNIVFDGREEGPVSDAKMRAFEVHKRDFVRKIAAKKKAGR